VETKPSSRFLPQTPIARTIALLSVVVTVAILGYWAWRSAGQDAGPTIGGSFALTDQFGKPRTDGDFRGQYMLVFFGFTNCPDICPIELQTMSDALDQLGADAAKVTPIFITVDPARDTPEALRDYVANFHPRLVALTGSEDAIGAVAKSYRVYYAKATGTDAPSNPADYIMNHFAAVYLMGPDGRYITHFSPGTPAEAMAQGLRDRL
jgi:protein SCO1/2